MKVLIGTVIATSEDSPGSSREMEAESAEASVVKTSPGKSTTTSQAVRVNGGAGVEENVAVQGEHAFGKNSKGHLIKHADVLGFGGRTPQELQKMVPQLENVAKDLFSKMKLERIGNWNEIENARFYIGEGKMIVTRQDGTFVTTIPKTSNGWFQKATPVKLPIK